MTMPNQEKPTRDDQREYCLALMKKRSEITQQRNHIYQHQIPMALADEVKELIREIERINADLDDISQKIKEAKKTLISLPKT